MCKLCKGVTLKKLTVNLCICGETRVKAETLRENKRQALTRGRGSSDAL